MRPGPVCLAIALIIVVSAPSCGGKTTTETRTVTAAAPTTGRIGPPAEQRLFGHIESLRRTGDHYELQFDPAWFLSGETANSAAAEDGAVEPGQPVPNDNYVVDEGDRLLKYLVPDDARVSVLTRRGEAAHLGATPVSVAELAKIVQGTSRLELTEPLDTGVWLRVNVDKVRAIDQQYRP
jgi:hypothetical protein